MSNFKVYLERAQGHDIALDISRFINENFASYLQKIITINEEKTTEEKNLENIINKIENKLNNLDLKIVNMPQTNQDGTNTKIKVQFDELTPKEIDLPKTAKINFLVKNKNNKYEKVNEIKDLGTIIARNTKNYASLSEDDTVITKVQTIDLIDGLSKYFKYLTGIETDIFFTENKELFIKNNHIELKVSTISDSPIDQNAVGGKTNNISNKNIKNIEKLYIHVIVQKKQEQEKMAA